MKADENLFPNAWDFGNSDKQMKSNATNYSIEYDDLSEIAMGAPLGGKTFLVIQNNKILIDNWCAGPPIWDTKGERAAIPKWNSNFWNGTYQQLLLIDILKRELTLFKRKFKVLELSSFDTNLITGIDNPKYKAKTICFDIENEKVEKVIKI